MSDSVPSNMLWIRAPTDPKSPKLFIKKMSPEGIDIGWVNQQNAENNIAVRLLFIDFSNLLFLFNVYLFLHMLHVPL